MRRSQLDFMKAGVASGFARDCFVIVEWVLREAQPALEPLGGSSVDCPSPSATVDELLAFAGTYDAYRRMADRPRSLDRIVRPVLRQIDERGVVPSWAGLDLRPCDS